MGSTIDVNKIDEKMQKNGWVFIGAILHYENAWKNQASIYKKGNKYVVSGIDSTGNAELNEKMSKKDAERRLKQSREEIKKFMFASIE